MGARRPGRARCVRPPKGAFPPDWDGFLVLRASPAPTASSRPCSVAASSPFSLPSQTTRRMPPSACSSSFETKLAPRRSASRRRTDAALPDAPGVHPCSSPPCVLLALRSLRVALSPERRGPLAHIPAGPCGVCARARARAPVHPLAFPLSSRLRACTFPSTRLRSRGACARVARSDPLRAPCSPPPATCHVSVPSAGVAELVRSLFRRKAGACLLVRRDSLRGRRLCARRAGCGGLTSPAAPARACAGTVSISLVATHSAPVC